MSMSAKSLKIELERVKAVQVLTPQQREIVRRLAEGQTRKQIADALKISEKTVAWHMVHEDSNRHSSIYARTGTNNLALLVRWAVRTGLVSCLVMVCNAQLPPMPMSVVLPLNTNGACAKLAWDYPTNEVGSIAGFKIFWGVASRNYSNSVGLNKATMTASPVTNAVVTFTNSVCGLTVRQKYYFAVSAYDASGAESDYSNEVLWQSPSQKTNRIITLSVATNGTATGAWNTDARFNTVTLTNPTGPEVYFKVAITQTNT